MMARDVDEWTVLVLEAGLPPLPRQLAPGETIPIALWRGERHGAALFVRRWRNGNIDSDCAISERSLDGSWARPGSWGGSGWIDDPLVRSATGWDGSPVVWLGACGSDGVRAVVGAASEQVAALGVAQDGREWTVPIESACGAFIVGIESAALVTIHMLDGEGRRLTDGDGATERIV